MNRGSYIRHKIIGWQSAGPYLSQFFSEHGISETELAKNNLIWRLVTYDRKLDYYSFWISHAIGPHDKHDTVSLFCITKLEDGNQYYVWKLTNWHSIHSPVSEMLFAHARVNPAEVPLPIDMGIAIQQDGLVRGLLVSHTSFKKGHIRTMKLFYTRLTDLNFNSAKIYLRNPKVSLVNQYFAVGILEEAISSVFQHSFSSKHSSNASIAIRPICLMAKEWAHLFYNSTINEKWEIILTKSLARVQIQCPVDHVERLVITHLHKWDAFYKSNPAQIPFDEGLTLVDDWALGIEPFELRKI